MEKYKSQIHELIDIAHNIAVIPSKVAGEDAFCAAAGLYHMLKNYPKNPTFMYQGKVPEKAVGVLSEKEITRDIKQRNLQVFINYSDTQAEKVNYSAKDNILTLSIGPVPNDFDPNERIRSKVTGFDFDLVFMVGVQDLRDLGQIYEELAGEIDKSKIVNIDNTVNNEKFGVKNAVDVDAPNLNILVFKLASEWGLEPDIKAAEAILKGLKLN
ncbi:hypothetical protein ACFL13_02215 [Patescibacteria group bacterium]